MIKSPRKKRSTERVFINCLNCNITFDVENYRKDTTKFCSRKCSALHKRIAISKECETCKKQFNHISSRCNSAKYCSRKCYYIGQRNKGKTQYICQHCNKKFKAALSKKRKFCSRSCINKDSKKTWKASFTTVRKAMLRRGLLEKCQLCSFDKMKEIIGVHHIDGDRHNNSLDNLMVLCPNCHSMEHKKHIVHAG